MCPLLSYIADSPCCAQASPGRLIRRAQLISTGKVVSLAACRYLTPRKSMITYWTCTISVSVQLFVGLFAVSNGRVNHIVTVNWLINKY